VYAAADVLADKVRARNEIARQVSKHTYTATRDQYDVKAGSRRPQHGSSNFRTATSNGIGRAIVRQFEMVSQIGSGRFAANLARYLRQAGVLRQGRIR
jgi:hypothetical protein